MAKTVIVGDDTLKDLVEAYASLSAGYYRMADAMRAAGVGCDPPTEDHRRAYVAQLAASYPELAAVVGTIGTPRLFLPPPVIAEPFAPVENEGVQLRPQPTDPVTELGGVMPPPMVDPNAVRY